jgi:hypothetical protein
MNDNTAAVPLSSTGGLSMQMLATKDRFSDGVVSFTKELDGIFGTDRFCGEPTTNPDNSRYDDLRHESARQEEALNKHCKTLATVDSELKEKQLAGKISYNGRLAEFWDYIDTELMPRIMLNEPKYARDSYGDEAGAYVEQASYHFRRGEIEQARYYLKVGEIYKIDEASVGCGGVGTSRKDKDPDGLNELVDAAIEGATEDNESGGEKKMTCPYCKETTTGDPCDSSVTCENCDACASDSASENERKAMEYKVRKIRKKLEAAKERKMLKKVKEAKDEQFSLAA